jgi:hypothetical protein
MSFTADIGPMLYTFLSVISEFLYSARVFVRLGWKSLPGTKTLVYYKNY